MSDLQEMLSTALTTKLNDGSIEKIVHDKIDKYISDIVSSAFDTWSEPSKQLKAKVSTAMCEIIEKTDISDYVTKLDHVIVQCLESSCLAENKQLLKNFQQIFGEKDNKSSYTIEDIFNKYVEYLKEDFDQSNIEEWDYDDGAPTAYINAECDIKDKSNSYSMDKKYEVMFSCDNDDDNKHTYKLEVYKYNFMREFHCRFSLEDNSIHGLRFAKSFELFLMTLAQNNKAIIITGNENLEESILIEQEQ